MLADSCLLVHWHLHGGFAQNAATLYRSACRTLFYTRCAGLSVDIGFEHFAASKRIALILRGALTVAQSAALRFSTGGSGFTRSRVAVVFVMALLLVMVLDHCRFGSVLHSGGRISGLRTGKTSH